MASQAMIADRFLSYSVVSVVVSTICTLYICFISYLSAFIILMVESIYILVKPYCVVMGFK
jgi:hypothetical protein